MTGVQTCALPICKAAMGKAVETMQNDRALVGVSDPDLVEQAALTGQSPTGDGIANGLKMRTLHYVKGALWDLSQSPGNRDPITMKYSANGRAILGQYHDLLNEMTKNDSTATKDTPGLYQQANQTYATPARVQDALNEGRGFRNLDPEEIQEYLQDKNRSAPEKAAFAAGVRRSLQDQIDTHTETKNPINALWKPNLQKRLEPLFSDKESYNNFATNMEHEKTMSRINNALGGGSDTFLKQEFNKPPQGGIGKALRFVGNAMEPGMLVSKLGDFADKQLDQNAKTLSQNSKTVIMRYLTTKDPALIRDLANRIDKNPVKAAK